LAALPHLPLVVQDIVQLQRVTGMADTFSSMAVGAKASAVGGSFLSVIAPSAGEPVALLPLPLATVISTSFLTSTVLSSSGAAVKDAVVEAPAIVIVPVLPLNEKPAAGPATV
jgi:hypothetical protein